MVSARARPFPAAVSSERAAMLRGGEGRGGRSREETAETLAHTHGTRWPGEQPRLPPGSPALSPPPGAGRAGERPGDRPRGPSRARRSGGTGATKGGEPGCRAALPTVGGQWRRAPGRCPRLCLAGRARGRPSLRAGREGEQRPVLRAPVACRGAALCRVSACVSSLLVVLCPWEEKQNVLGDGRGRGRLPLPAPPRLSLRGASGTPVRLCDAFWVRGEPRTSGKEAAGEGVLQREPRSATAPVTLVGSRAAERAPSPLLMQHRGGSAHPVPQCSTEDGGSRRWVPQCSS